MPKYAIKEKAAQKPLFVRAVKLRQDLRCGDQLRSARLGL